MIENFSKLGRCKVPLLELEISKTSKVSRRHTREIVADKQVVWRYRPQNFNCSRRIIFVELYRSSRRRQAESLNCKIVGDELIQLLHEFLGFFCISCASPRECGQHQNIGFLAPPHSVCSQCLTLSHIPDLGVP